jgi:hypothetical protein
MPSLASIDRQARKTIAKMGYISLRSMGVKSLCYALNGSRLRKMDMERCVYLDTVELLAPVLLLVEFARTPSELRATFFKSVPIADNICLEWLSIGAELF